MTCKPICKLCSKLVISQSVSFTGGNLIINIPSGDYQNCQKYCIVIAQSIPTTTTINAPVYITIGTGTELYPLTKSNCSQVTACAVRTRTRYATCVLTNPTGATFRLLGQPCCSPNNALNSVNGTAPVAEPALVSFNTPTKKTTKTTIKKEDISNE